MINFNQTKANAMEGIARKSTLVTFILATLGVVGTAYLASKEIPKAKAEAKTILDNKDLTKSQKVTETVKVVAKSTWKTTAVAALTVLLVTGTAAITTANAATTVAGLTSALNLAETKLKDTTEAINNIPDKKVKEEVKREVTQKAVNRATADISDTYFERDERCPLMYVWTDAWTGVTFKATMDMVETAADIFEARFATESYQTIYDFYSELRKRGAIFEKEDFPQLAEDYAWKYTMGFYKEVHDNVNGWTVHTIHYDQPTTDF